VIWTIEFGGDPQDVTVKTAGLASREGFFGFNAELAADPRWRPGMAVLLDHSALDSDALTCADIEEIADFVAHLDDQFGYAAFAIVAPDSYTAGLADVSIRYLDRSRMVARTFASRQPALDWLELQRAPRLA
jgi:hypothetical protein